MRIYQDQLAWPVAAAASPWDALPSVMLKAIM